MVEASEISNQSPVSAEASEHVRGAELAQLKGKFSSTDGGTVLLRGPAGVGKSRLASEFIRFVERQGSSLVLQGYATGRGDASFSAFAEIVRQAMAWAESVGLWDAVVEPVYSDLEPVLELAAADGVAAPSVDQKLRFFEAVRSLLKRVAAETRVLAVVHGLERADQDTLELSNYLVTNLFGDAAFEPDDHGSGVLLLVTRDGAGTREDVLDFLSAVQAQPGILDLELRGLDLDGLRRYVQNPKVLERLYEASCGLPQELDALFDALPTNVEELFVRRLEGMNPEAREVLSALAVHGEAASARALATVAKRPIAEVAQTLSQQRAARNLERTIVNGDIRFAFARRANLETALRMTESIDLQRLHGSWAQFVAAQRGQGGASVVAFHQLRSDDPARGVPLALKAAESHTVAGAFDAATRLLEEALPHAGPELDASILERLSELASLRGQPRAAIRYLKRWKASVPERLRTKALLREVKILNGGGEYELALKTIAEAKAQSPEPAEWVALEREECEAHYQLGTLSEASALGRELLKHPYLEEAPCDQISVLNLLGKIALASDEPAKARRVFEETQALAARAKIPTEQARALLNIGFAKSREGDRKTAAEYLQAGLEKARATGDLELLAFGHLNLGVLAHKTGDLGTAIERYRACRSLFSRLGNRTQLARALYNLGNLFLAVGDLRRAQSHADEALRLSESVGGERLSALSRLLQAALLSANGEFAAAKETLDAVLTRRERLGDSDVLKALLDLAELELAAGSGQAAQATAARARSYLARIRDQRLAAKVRLVEARSLAMLGQREAFSAFAEAHAMVGDLGEALLERDLVFAEGQAHLVFGQSEEARKRFLSARHLQERAAQDLPESFRTQFLKAAPQVAIGTALQALDAPTPSAPSTPLPATASPQTPVARPGDWATRYESIVGGSPKLHRVFRILDRVSKSEGTVLIYGESGTGKELVAEAIHRGSARANGPFVKLNCAALVESLLLSELFGHERGAFTGAHQRKIGRFEMAAKGTIFLDEIGDISLKTQVSLLRVLQEFEFERVGGGKPIRLEARIVCATNRNLAQMVRDGTFREDLYYRLKGLSVDLPPLRSRREDIPMLADHFLAVYAKESGSVKRDLSPAARQTLSAYRWPGNIRELENVVRSVALFADGETIERSDFDEYQELFQDPDETLPSPPAQPSLPPAVPPVPLFGAESADVVARPTETPMVAPEPARTGFLDAIFTDGVPLAALKQRIQDEAIATAINRSQGNITRAAEMLGMKRPRLSQIINASEALKQLCSELGR